MAEHTVKNPGNEEREFELAKLRLKILESVKIHSSGVCTAESDDGGRLLISGGGSLAELFEVDLTVAVGIGEVHHLGDDIIGHIFAKAAKKLGKLILGDDAILVLVENGEGLLELLELFSRKVGHLN